MKVRTLVSVIAASLISAFCIAGEIDRNTLGKVSPAEIESEVIARGGSYIISLLSCNVVRNDGVTMMQPGLSLVHTDLKTGQMTWLVSLKGMFIGGEQRDILEVKVVGIEQTDQFVATAVLLLDGLTFSSGNKPLTDIERRLDIFRKTDGKMMQSATFPMTARHPDLWPKETTEAGIIKKLENGIEVCGTVFEFTDDGKVIRKDPEGGAGPSVICAFPPKDMVFRSPEPGEGEGYRFIPHHGYAESVPGRAGLYVFSGKHHKYLRIIKVTTKGGTFGREPTDEERRIARTGFPEKWEDFGKLARKDYAEIPLLMCKGEIHPDQIETDEKSGVVILHFNSRWGIKGVETILKFKISDLEKAFDEAKGGRLGEEDNTPDN